MAQEILNTVSASSTREIPLGSPEPTLSELIMRMDDGKGILERSGLDKPEVISLVLDDREVTCYIGANVKGVRVVVANEGYYSRKRRKPEDPRWKATTISSESFESPEEREKALKKFLKTTLIFRDEQIGTLVSNLSPRPPRGPDNGK